MPDWSSEDESHILLKKSSPETHSSIKRCVVYDAKSLKRMATSDEDEEDFPL